jgi:hypothetical protein
MGELLMPVRGSVQIHLEFGSGAAKMVDWDTRSPNMSLPLILSYAEETKRGICIYPSVELRFEGIPAVRP